MILKWIFQALGALVEFVSGLFAFVPSPPTFFTDIAGYVDDVAGFMAGTSAWLPWQLLMSVLALWAISATTAVTIRIVRIVASFFTAGGGSAA
jgi:hypothetical protein